MNITFKEKNCTLFDAKKKEFEAHILSVLEKFKVLDELWSVKIDVEFINNSQLYEVSCFANHSKGLNLNAKFSDKNLDFLFKKLLEKLTTQLKKKIKIHKV
ncbi:hypothetical protein JTY60_02705 [symbiont of Argiope bruennichi]|uniref:hypothetical protein n=1 Tax=symbiont of Argiope bruennichi TaxID=2810479 RepID=UPI003DA615A7